MEAAAHHRARPLLRVWQATLLLGLISLGMAYIGHFSPGGARVYQTWFYEGLELLASLGILADPQVVDLLCDALAAENRPAANFAAHG